VSEACNKNCRSRSELYRRDTGGNRRLNSAFCMFAVIRIAHDPGTAIYLAKHVSELRVTQLWRPSCAARA
jgi:hypothetical protein